MKKLSLRPYHGTIWLCESVDEMHKAYKRLTKEKWPHGDTDVNGGRFCYMLSQLMLEAAE